MKLKNFFINCLNRKSFQFLNCVGIFFIFILFSILTICIVKNVNAYDLWALLLYCFDFILPTLTFVTILSIIIIYIKLLIREHKNSEYRIKNKFLTQNPIYGLFAFCFYILAILFMIALLYLISVNVTIYHDPIFLNRISLYKYPFIIYILILVFIIKKI